MSADDMGPDLEGLLGGLEEEASAAKKAPAKKAAAKKAAPSKAEEPVRDVHPEDPAPLEDVVEEETPETFPPADQTGGTWASTGTTSGTGSMTVTVPQPVPPKLTPEDIEAIREEIRASVMAEFRQAQAAERARANEATLRAIDAKHKGSLEPGADTHNPFAYPVVDNPEELPSLIHFVTDGFTINETVTYRGQEYEPTEHDSWAMLTTQEQIRRYGEIKFRVGPWDGLPFDLDDPALTTEDRNRLESIMRSQYAQRVLVAPVE